MYKTFIDFYIGITHIYNIQIGWCLHPTSRKIVDRIQTRVLKIANSYEELNSLDQITTVGAIVLFYRYHNGLVISILILDYEVST